MENGLFRKKSLEHISSPEELHDYMRVTSPRIWMILGAIIVLLAGFIVFASTTTMENVMPIRVEIQTVESSEEPQGDSAEDRYTLASCHLPLSEIDRVKTGMEVRIAGEKGRVRWIVTSDADNEFVFQIEMEQGYVPMPDGEYDAELVLETTTPISFLWN